MRHFMAFDTHRTAGHSISAFISIVARKLDHFRLAKCWKWKWKQITEIESASKERKQTAYQEDIR